jgi:hypothetical protein
MLIYKIEDQLNTARKLINGALHDPEILEKLSHYRYDKDQILKAKALYEKVIAYQEQKKAEYEEVNLVTIRDDRKEAHRIYIRHLAIAREAFPKRIGAEFKPKPLANKNPSESTWLDQALIFYNNIMYSASELMIYGIEKSELEQAKAMMEAVKATSLRHIKGQDEFKAITEKRDQAYSELLRWMFKFKAIVQLVLEDEPEKLARLGFELES